MEIHRRGWAFQALPRIGHNPSLTRVLAAAHLILEVATPRLSDLFVDFVSVVFLFFCLEVWGWFEGKAKLKRKPGPILRVPLPIPKPP